MLYTIFNRVRHTYIHMQKCVVVFEGIYYPVYCNFKEGRGRGRGEKEWKYVCIIIILSVREKVGGF